MTRRHIPASEWQYRERSSVEVRGTLLRLTHEFVLAARQVPGVIRIALLGSLISSKARPKDADVLVSIAPIVDLARLARLARQLQGRAHTINSTADVFLAGPDGEYLGRVCPHRECYDRRSCHARHCGVRQHLRDDLDLVTLAHSLVIAPPLVVHPQVTAAIPIPDDVRNLLLLPLDHEQPASGDSASGGARAL